MEILNLYAGLGGNRFLWPQVVDGMPVKVTAVEINHEIADYYSCNFPGDKLVIGDAHQYLLKHFDKFDVVWSSPPCQSHSRMTSGGRNRKPRYRDFSLYEQIDFLKRYSVGSWVVENVVPAYKPMFEYQLIGRHAMWSSSDLANVAIYESPQGFGNSATAQELAEWLGITYDYNIYYNGNNCPKQVLRNCVHPRNGLSILNKLISDNRRMPG